MSKRKLIVKPQSNTLKSPAAAPTGGGKISDAAKFIRLSTWGIFLLSVILYANTLFHNYAVDDAIVIYDNEFTTIGLAGIPDLFRYDTFRGFFKVEGKENLVAGGRYRPLTPAMYALEVQLFAPKKRDAAGLPVKDKNGNQIFDPDESGKLNTVKFVGHFVNVLLYGLTGVVLFWLLLRLFSPASASPLIPHTSYLIPLTCTLLFMVHPIHSEVVANIKGRDEIVSLLGSLAALLLSWRAFSEKKPGLNLAAGALFFLALLSKENAITFLAVVPLTYFFFSRANVRQVILQTLPFVAAAAVFLVIRTSVIGLLPGEPPKELMNNPFLKLVGTQYVDFSAGEKFATIFYTLGKYLQLLVLPHPLTHDYYPRHIPILGFGDWKVILSLLVYLALGIYALLRLPKKDPVSYGILFFLATISIVSNIVFPVGTTMNERFAYMPSVGFCLVVAVLFAKLAGKNGRLPMTAMVVGGLILLAYSGKTFVRNFVWKDNFTLFLTDVKTAPGSAKLQNSSGGELIAQSLKPGNEERKNDMLREAITHLNEAIKIHPGYKNPFLLLGNAYNYLQEYEASIQAYEHALRLDPNYGEAKNNLAITYQQAGRYFGEEKNDLAKSLAYLQKAYELKPDDYETLRLLGVAHGVAGYAAKAAEYFEKALVVKPGDADAMYNLASAYYYLGQEDKAKALFQQAKQANPNIEAERKTRK